MCWALPRALLPWQGWGTAAQPWTLQHKAVISVKPWARELEKCPFPGDSYSRLCAALCCRVPLLWCCRNVCKLSNQVLHLVLHLAQGWRKAKRFHATSESPSALLVQAELWASCQEDSTIFRFALKHCSCRPGSFLLLSFPWAFQPVPFKCMKINNFLSTFPIYGVQQLCAARQVLRALGYSFLPCIYTI